MEIEVNRIMGKNKANYIWKEANDMKINWTEEVEKRKEQLIVDTQKLLQIKSVLEEGQEEPGAPFGKGIKQALDHMLQLGEADGFTPKNLEGYAGHLEMGEGPELLGILGHLDVVPEGEGWMSDPYGAEIRDGKIFARGAIDDKGPTMAAYYAMKIVKELELPLSKRVRLILGTDEESEWRCMDHYFENEEMPTFGFVPDADFPIIYAEKGISDFDLIWEAKPSQGPNEWRTERFVAGERYNMVPDSAKAEVIAVSGDPFELEKQFRCYCDKEKIDGSFSIQGNKVILQTEGLSVHGMEPDLGVNAGLKLATFLADLNVNGEDKQFFTFIKEKLVGDSRAKKIGIAYADDITGDLTINYGIIRYESAKGGRISFNMRYPVTFKIDAGEKTIQHLAETNGFAVKPRTHLGPHHVDANSELIKTLQRVYEEQTGEPAKLLAIGGGTYARSLTEGVAFGPMFPGREDVAHQKDEYFSIEDLLRSTAIYAQAIYELAK